MRRIMSVCLILALAFLVFNPAPVEAGGKDWLIGGLIFGGGMLLGSALNSHDRDHVIAGPVYTVYPSPVYYQPPLPYPPPVYYYPPAYPPQARWIPDHYELRWQQPVCEIMYQRQRCYQTQITVFIPGHWEY